MESKLVKLKSDFINIINIRNTVKNIFDTLQVRIDTLRQIYSEFIKNNKNDMFVFGLDSFQFQNKFIDIEYDDMMRLFLAINNRMYCEYFKLHKIIIEYIIKNINDKKISDLVKNNDYPIYKDLEPFKEYKFEIILDIHENILNMVSILISVLNNKENELSIHKTKQNIGLNIDNFITTFNFNINVMKEKILMFITYIEFFHKMHSKYLKRFSNKIQLMYTHITNDIKFDDSVEISKNKKKELIEDFFTNNMDKELLKDLKSSIGSETNSDISSDSSNSIHNKNIDSDNSSQIETYINEENKVFLNSEEKSTKKDYKKFFHKNVHKLSNYLHQYKSKNNKSNKNNFIKTKFSDYDIAKMFNGIEESCDSIINDKKNHTPFLDVNLNSNSFDNLDNTPSIQIKIEENNNYQNENVIQEENIQIKEPETII